MIQSISVRTLVKSLHWNKHIPKRNRALMGARCTLKQAKLITWFVDLETIFDLIPAPTDPLPSEQFNLSPVYPRTLMRCYFSQWLIGLCYEIVFPDLFHMYGLN